MIMDKNGVEIMTGDIVRIENAYFKVDNGLYFVSDREGDPTTCGTGLTLRRILKDGSLSEGRNKIAFWPLMHCCSDREKRAIAYDWDSEHATITIATDDVNTEHIVNWFRGEAENLASANEHWKWEGRHSHNYVVNEKIRRHYLRAAERLEVIKCSV